MPKYYIDELVKYHKNKKIIKSLKGIGGTFIHEHFHIFQKNHKQFFYHLYENLWNFKKMKNLKNLDISFSINQRLNPDTIDMDWVYYNEFNKKYYYPTALLKNQEDFNLSSPDKMLLSVDKIGEYEYSYNQNMSKINENLVYDNKFCKINQIYHPNEISAVFWTENILDEMKIKKMPTNRKICTNQFQEYMKNHLSYTITNNNF